MRRYWLSIIIAVLAVSGLGTYYTFGRQNHLPEYKLETIQGDSREGKAVNLSGAYNGDMRSDFLRVNTSGSEYGGSYAKNIRLGLTEAHSWLYRQPDIQQLLIDHKSFMRGKGNKNGFYRDEDWVIYSDVSLKNKGSKAPIANLQLTLLDEATDKVSTLKQTYELPKEPSSIHVEDVQLLDEKAYILIKKFFIGFKSNDIEYEIVVLDLTSGKLLRNEKLEKWKSPTDDINMQVRIILTDKSSAPSETIFFDVSEVKINKKTGDSYSDKLSEKYYSYSYRTGLFTELPDMGWESAADANSVISLQHDYFYFAEFGLNHITLSRYSLKTKELERAYASVSTEQLGVDEIKSVQISSNRVYLLFNQAGVAGAAVLDLTNGEVLFIGRTAEIGNEQETADDMKENLHLLNMEIVEKIKD